jgi:hypothetical protein
MPSIIYVANPRNADAWMLANQYETELPRMMVTWPVYAVFAVLSGGATYWVRSRTYDPDMYLPADYAELVRNRGILMAVFALLALMFLVFTLYNLCRGEHRDIKKFHKLFAAGEIVYVGDEILYAIVERFKELGPGHGLMTTDVLAHNFDEVAKLQSALNEVRATGELTEDGERSVNQRIQAFGARWVQAYQDHLAALAAGRTAEQKLHDHWAGLHLPDPKAMGEIEA